MKKEETKLIIDNLLLIKELELEIAALYNVCASAFPAFGPEFWEHLSSEEIKHADCVTRLMDAISSNPEMFVPGLSFNSVAISTVIRGIKLNIERVKSGEIQEDKILFIARDIENSIIEARYKEIVKTGDEEFMAIVERINKETFKHRNLLTQKIGRLNSRD